jgi:hypothetical protein
MKMVDLKNEKVVDYFEMMIDEFNCGNDNEYKVGSRVSFKFEECEKGDLDNYDEEDVNAFFEIRKYIEDEGGELKYIGEFDDKDLEYTFKVVGEDIECSWIEPKWGW